MSRRKNNITDTEMQQWLMKNSLEDEKSGCWLWSGYTDKRGRPRITYRKRQGVLVHRVAFELFRRKIPETKEPHHFCENIRCINPWHLEPVTHKRNVLIGSAPTAQNARKTHCIYGHLLVQLKTKRGERGCPICLQKYHLTYKLIRKINTDHKARARSKMVFLD